MNISLLKAIALGIATLSPLASVFGWGEPHLAITKAALDVLPTWQKEVLGDEITPLANYYCIIPDKVYSDKENVKFAMMDSRPSEVYIKNLHLPATQSENIEVLRYFMEKAVTALKSGNNGDAARYMGTICHQLEDYGSPSHTVPGDNMFTLLQQFLPPSEGMKGKLLHGPIENGTFEVSIKDYQPRLLGITVEEAAWRLLHRVHEGIINARSTTIPIIQALYADDAKAVLSSQMKAATMDAKVVADAIYTMLCLGTQKFEDPEQVSLRTVGIANYFPLEAVNLYFPQSEFFGSPYWGCARSGVILEEGTKEVPLKLRIAKDGGVVEQEFAKGISAGMGKTLTFHLPKDVYQRFTVLAGLHPQLGAKGRVEFTINGDGKPLATATLGGEDPAQLLDCDLTGVSQIQLVLTSRGLNPKSNYAIWAEPTLIKR
ncbi:hypothetical protein BH11VER1_BH11VER1_33550 [soil metagenome]